MVAWLSIEIRGWITGLDLDLLTQSLRCSSVTGFRREGSFGSTEPVSYLFPVRWGRSS